MKMQKMLEIPHRVCLELAEMWRFCRWAFFGDFENKGKG